ncbi:hypothetical protein LBMAG10_13800 [Actinomycetes bacterium]|nr:hypothetical protein LBMAG10_13800 [Actinomycetes bacterium]
MNTQAEHISQEFDKPVRGNDLLGMYRKMFMIRRTEEAVLDLRRADLIAGSAMAKSA